MPGEHFDFDTLQDRGFPILRKSQGEKVFSVGEKGDCLFLVKSGTVQIVMFGTVLETIKPNGIFGEMALIDGAPRSATAIANEDCELLRVDRDAFRQLVRENPDFALDVMHVIANRLRHMNESV